MKQYTQQQLKDKNYQYSAIVTGVSMVLSILTVIGLIIYNAISNGIN